MLKEYIYNYFNIFIKTYFLILILDDIFIVHIYVNLYKDESYLKIYLYKNILFNKYFYDILL